MRREAKLVGTPSESFSGEGRELTLVPYALGFNKPVDLRAFTGGRLLVVQQEGLVVLASPVAPTVPLLDLRRKVSCCVEQGLLSLSLHPEFERNGLLFVYYTDLEGNGVLSRFHVEPGKEAANPASEEVILRVPQPGPTHNGGQLQFGPDGYLYLSLGDGEYRQWEQGVKTYAQDRSLLLGKLLRLDVDAAPYAIPWDNPLTGMADVRQEIWASGLRNPWRFSFDRETGDLWLGDVGQNFYEKIIFQPANSAGGENYGWPILGERACLGENNCDLYGFTRPAIVYTRRDGCAVTGGYVYRGKALTGLRGHYLYGDFCTGRLWAAQRNKNNWKAVELLDTDFIISTFGEDAQGEVYVADYARGTLYKLTTKTTSVPRSAD